MDTYTAPESALGLALTALLVVVGYRVARPRGPLAWVAVLGYVAALVSTFLGARGAPGAGGLPAGVRIPGAVAIVAGLVIAGAALRSSRRVERTHSVETGPARQAGVHAGLALVLVGQLARAPSHVGAYVTATAVLVLAVAAFTSWRDRSRVRPVR